ncbi:MAG: C25 family cysteine peptidase [bacterium]
MKKVKYAMAVTALLTGAAAVSLADTVQTTLTFDETDFDFSTITIEGEPEPYDFVTYEEGNFHNVPGEPTLPVAPYSFSIPFGSTVTNVVITDSESEIIDDNYYLYPGQVLLPIGGESSYDPTLYGLDFTEPEPGIYEDDDPFPDEILIDRGSGESRGHLLADFRVFPMQYVAEEDELNELKLYTSITVQVTYTPPQGQPEAERYEWPELYELWAEKVEDTVVNAGDVDDDREPVNDVDVMEWGTETVNGEEIPWVKPAESGYYEYNLPHEVEGYLDPDHEAVPSYPFPFIVITNDEWVTAAVPKSQPGLLEALDDFYEWKMRKGVPLHIVMVDDIIDNWEGDDNQDKIRNWMKAVVDVYGTQAFMFVGDTAEPPEYTSATWETYGDYGVVPSRFVCTSPDYYIHPSDFYFACLDGTWGPFMKNSIGYYGVSDVTGLNLRPTVTVGRVPVGDATGGDEAANEAEAFVQMLVKYEKNPEAGYLDEVLFIAADFGVEQCRDQLWGGPYFDGFSERHVYEGTSPTTEAPLSNYPTYPEAYEVRDALEVGAGITVFATHAQPLGHYILTQWSEYPRAEVFTVDKDITFSWGHSMIFPTGQKQVDNHEKYGLLYSHACYPFKYVYKDDEGRECFGEEYLCHEPSGGAAYIGNTTVGTPVGSLVLMKYFFKRLLLDENYVIGYPQVWSRADYCNGLPTLEAYSCNLGGDPTMEVWSDDPGSLSLTYSWEEVEPIGLEVEVHVTDSAENDVEGAKVCLWESKFYLTTTTGNGGKCTFKDIWIGFNDGKLTATKHNYKPALEDDVVVGVQ